MSSDTTCFPVFTTTATGNRVPKTDSSSLTYNSSNGTLSATTFSGALTGDVTITTSQFDESSDTILYSPTATGDQGPKTGSNLTFNSSTGPYASFVGDVTGNSDTSTQVKTIRTFWYS